MCGIVGIAARRVVGNRPFEDALAVLLRLAESRGKEAAGVVLNAGKRTGVWRDASSASDMLRSAAYRKFIAERLAPIPPQQWVSALGHARLVTQGMQAINRNNQPVVTANVITLHNGIVLNEKELWERLAPRGWAPATEVDSEVLGALVANLVQDGADPAEIAAELQRAVEGEASCAFYIAPWNMSLCFTNTGSMHLATAGDGSILFSSERYAVAMAAKKLFADPACVIISLAAGEYATIQHFDDQAPGVDIARTRSPAPSIAPKLAEQRSFEDAYELDLARRANLRRCTKCLLTETMPFITFDEQGVCNYCRQHEPERLQGEAALHDLLDRERARFGKNLPCVVAFSGGRDSSYGLHLLHTKLGVRPIAYTYDWGMVTAIARRNQSRMCSRLGIEHIWVSADIAKKRRFIKMNLEAWLKTPKLGLIPLFMAGDKQFFYHFNVTRRRLGGIPAVLCTNNFERTDFKSGFAGVPPNPPGRIHYRLGLRRQLSLAAYFGGSYLRNPAFLNASIPDSLGAFAAYYLMRQDYIRLYDYLPWREQDVNDVLLNEYRWEVAEDTSTTWRIGDGTAAFYNYVYHTVAGFTEADTLRSRQIREGHITRDEGMRLIADENRPRWRSIREYFETLNSDFSEAIRVVERIPKLY